MWSSLPPKAINIIIAVALLGMGPLILSACGGTGTSGSQANKSNVSNSSFKEVTLEVPTIWCSTCKLRVETSSRSVPGVREVRFDTQRIEIVYITYDSGQTSPQAIVEAIERGGDKVSKVIER